MSQSGTLNRGIMPPGSAVQTLTTQDGNAVPPNGANTIFVVGGANIETTGNIGTSTVTIAVTPNIELNNTNAAGTEGVYLLGGNSFMHNGGVDNTFVGELSGTFALDATASQNTAIGALSLNSISLSGENNTAVGYSALQALTTSAFNTAIGHEALLNIQAGSDGNTALGAGAGNGLISGNNNVFISSSGMANDDHVIRIGDLQTEFYATGIYFATPITQPNRMVVISSDDQLTSMPIAGSLISITTVNTTPYVVGTDDYYLSVQTSLSAYTIELPNAPQTGRSFIIKDANGNAAANNITVTTVGGVVTIDGVTSFVMNTAYQSIQVVFNGSSYEVF